MTVCLGFSFTVILVIPFACLLCWSPCVLALTSSSLGFLPYFGGMHPLAASWGRGWSTTFFGKLCISENVWFSYHTCLLLVIGVQNSRQETIFLPKALFPWLLVPGLDDNFDDILRLLFWKAFYETCFLISENHLELLFVPVFWNFMVKCNSTLFCQQVLRACALWLIPPNAPGYTKIYTSP